MKMHLTELVRSLAKRTRVWRENAVKALNEAGCNDLHYRPDSGMSSLGWILAHQAAVYDYTLNVLIRSQSAKKPDLLDLYAPGTDGAWEGTSRQEIEDYYDSGERDFLAWVENAKVSDFARVLKGDCIPKLFRRMRVVDVIANAFVHLNHHNGHLSAINGDWRRRQRK